MAGSNASSNPLFEKKRETDVGRFQTASHHCQTFSLLHLRFALDFKQVWRVLKSAGWTALPGRGVANWYEIGCDDLHFPHRRLTHAV